MYCTMQPYSMLKVMEMLEMMKIHTFFLFVLHTGLELHQRVNICARHVILAVFPRRNERQGNVECDLLQCFRLLHYHVVSVFEIYQTKSENKTKGGNYGSVMVFSIHHHYISISLSLSLSPVWSIWYGRI